MILATDVDYRADGGAVAAGVLFADWTDARPAAQATVRVDGVRPYVPGRFFERELPCLLALLDTIAAPPHIVVVDGHATLGAARRPGLGAVLHQALGGRIPVVGVAKTAFRNTPDCNAVLRGQSAQPLYVTSVGMPPDAARRHVASMHGPHRVPTLLRAVDRLCRTA